MPSLRIRIGAALDANALKAFLPLEQAGERARRNIERSLNSAGTSGAKAARPIVTEWAKIEKELDREANRIVRVQERAARTVTKEFEKSQKDQTASAARESKRREDIVRRSSEMAGREAARLANIEIHAAERAARAAESQAKKGNFWSSGGGRIGIGRRAGIAVSRGTAALYGYGGAGLSSIARGLGVDTDVAGMMQTGVNNQDLAQKIINSSPQYNSASVGSRQVAAQGLEAQAQHVGNATGTSTSETLEALESFVAKTGELGTAQDTIGNLARLSRATGTNLADMANAAAEVSLNLGNVPDKAKVIDDVMRSIAGQGKKGAVEIKDLAQQMAKVASVAGAFEGDRGKNIAILGGMAQAAKAHGGAAGAAQATTSIQAFVTNLTQGGTIKNWQAMHLSPYTDPRPGHRNTIRSPEELILEALRATKGDLPQLNKLFGSKLAMRPVRAYADTYKTAGGGEEGLKAVHEEFESYARAAMTAEQVTMAFNAQMDTSKSKVQVFNNEMQQTAEKLQSALLPAVEQTAPMIVGMAHGFASIMDSDFMKTVLHGGDQAGKTQQNSEFSAQVNADNFISTLRAFRGGPNVHRTGLGPGPWAPGQGMGPIDTDASMAAAAPIFAGGAEQQKILAQQIASSDEQLKKDRSNFHLYHKDLGIDDATIAATAKQGDKEGTKYIQDKAANERLHQSQGDLATALDGLKNAIEGGQLMVTLAPGSPVPAPGTTPPNSPPPT